jgi:4-hydroxy-4-methyl-2-oxoglutarate aldolase
VGEVDVHTGDWLVGDADGVTVVRAAQIVDVLAAGQARAAREQALFEALRNGKTTLELLGIDPSPIDDESDR